MRNAEHLQKDIFSGSELVMPVESPLPDVTAVLDRFSRTYFPEMIAAPALCLSGESLVLSSFDEGRISPIFDAQSIAALVGKNALFAHGDALSGGCSRKITVGEVQGPLIRRTTGDGYTLHYEGAMEEVQYEVNGRRGKDKSSIELVEHGYHGARRLKATFADTRHSIAYLQGSGGDYLLVTGEFHDGEEKVDGGNFGARVFRGKNRSSEAMDVYKKS